ncbi:MAG: glycosyltransferase [Hyphomicrobium sp.]
MPPPLRALFFSHDRRGLGHIRRTLALADNLLDHMQHCTVMVVTGSRMAHAFRMRPRLDYVKLPSVATFAGGVLASGTLDVPHDEILKIREELLLQTTRLFQPDVLLLGSPPLTEYCEITRTVAYVRANMPQTAIVLNLRDIPDDPARADELWGRQSVQDMLEKNYDRILVHGSRCVYDLPKEYGFTDKISSKTFFCGYVPRSCNPVSGEVIRRKLCSPDHKLLVLTVGGGVDGSPLIEQCLAAVSSDSALNEVHTLAILGPDMPLAHSATLRVKYANNTNISFLDFVEPASDYFAAADVIISMGGYNTLCEISALRKCVIVIPRVHQSTEQFVRARRFADLGLVQMLHPDEAAPVRIAAAIVDAIRQPWVPSQSLEFGDGATFARMVQEIATSRNVKGAWA